MKGRLRKTKGAGSRIACLATAFKLALSTQEHWRKVNAPHLVALVRAGVPFKDGAAVDIHRMEEHSDQLAEEIAA